jgi:hypothetical protein
MKESARVFKSLLGVAIVALTIAPALGCTIFLLTDEEQVLFFNNENAANRPTRIWFIPGGKDHYGAVYVGFDDGGAQGGMNTEGLAIDWVSQFDEEWEDRRDKPMVRGNYGERMLEQCATVAEAVEFFQKYYHPTFARTRALIADKSGASVIVGAEDGKAYIDWSAQSRGFGTGFDDRMMRIMATEPPKPTVENGLRLLQRLRERGRTATRYSNAFNVRTGEIHILHQDARRPVTLQLHEELARGSHYYTIKSLHTAPRPVPRPLEINMHRSLVDAFPPLEEQPSELIDKSRVIFGDLRAGAPKRGDFAQGFWTSLRPEIQGIRSDLAVLGDLESIALVRIEHDESVTDALYLMEFATGWTITRLVWNSEGRVANLALEAYEPKGRE